MQQYDSRREFAQGLDGVLYYQPPVPALPAADGGTATVVLYNADGTELQAAASVDVDFTATTLDGAIVAGARSAVLTDDLDTNEIFAGMGAWLGSVDDGPLEQVVVLSRATATKTVTFKEPVKYGHADDVAFHPSRLLYDLTSTHTATKATAYRALWTYQSVAEGAGVDILGESLFDVVVSPFVIAENPMLLQAHIPNHVRAAIDTIAMEDIKEAAVDGIKMDLRRALLVPANVVDREQFELALVFRIRAILATRAFQTNPALERAMTVAWDAYQGEFDRVMAARLAWYDENGDRVVGETEQTQGTYRYFHERRR